MLRLSCPWCGTRDELEFSFGGESHVTRPTLDAGDVEWSDYLSPADGTIAFDDCGDFSKQPAALRRP